LNHQSMILNGRENSWMVMTFLRKIQNLYFYTKKFVKLW
jgi:hypothetical protein